MKKNLTKKFKKKIKFTKDYTEPKTRFSIGKKYSFINSIRQIQISNTTLAEKILKGTVDLESLRQVQNKKEMNTLQGRYSSVSLERFITKNLKEQKRKKLLSTKDKNKSGRGHKYNAERMAFFKLKREPERNKTHWDHLLEEMKWMANDFEKERKIKKKTAYDMTKYTKKGIETRHLEIEKQTKRIEQDLKKRSQLIARSVNNYWRKIEKIAKYNYNTSLNENKIVQQQNRLMSFINKLTKISERVAESLKSKGTVASSVKDATSDAQSIADEEFTITLKKNEDGSVTHMDNDENFVAKAAFRAEQFQPKGTQLIEANINVQQPFLLKNELREYQLIGLHWLLALHDNKINGILADEMGLGKTIQTIALFAYLAANRGNWGPHLIIVPTTIIVNWEIEFKKWCPSLKILSYFGNQKERKAKRHGWHKPNAFNVCITSYKLVIQDYSIFKRKRWYYIVLDEAHNIKNFKSKRWQMLLNFKSKRKLLLTGTPLQNDIMEIWSYLHFLMPNLFYSNEEFREWFHTQFYNAIHNNAALNNTLIQSVHSILRPFLLRRLKKDVEKQLPEKIEHVVYCDLSRRQKYLYDEYINADKTQETLKKNDYFSIMNVLMQLRKVCNHPDLFDSRDYMTPSRQLWEVLFVVPSLVMNLNNINRVPYFHLFDDKLTMKDYASLINNFPQRSFHEVYEEITKGASQLYQPKYLIDDNDILFKREYADSTLLHSPNSQSLAPTATESTYNIQIPSFICPTNIPLVQNNSMNNYYDIVYPIDTTDLKNGQTYLKSVFSDNIERQRKILQERKKKLLHYYDLNSRKIIVHRKPSLFTDTIRVVKIKSALDQVNNTLTKSQILFSSPENSLELARTTTNSYVLNKANKFVNIPRTNSLNVNVTYEESQEDTQLNDKLCTNMSSKTCKFTRGDFTLGESINFYNSDAMPHLIYSPGKFLHLCDDLMTNFRVSIPKIICRGPQLVPSRLNYETITTRNKYRTIYNNLNKISSVVKFFSLSKIISFPDKKLVEYDSGKLIRLAQLLKKLKANKSKALIFTQMTRMLDILEVFLNIHGYNYLRLDGSTKVELRQQIVDRFNTDPKIFCFISSTRSGGIGINLTGADCVIFYDTDWNPAMDKQAQDRCHRIGQTQTVHIYRLITLSTIEENIFKKSIQKRELNYVVMEDGKFDTNHFSKINFKSIVEEEHLIKSNNPRPDDKIKRMLEFENLTFENEEEQKNIEQMLIKIEDQEDVQALKNVSKEMLDEYEKENQEQQFINEEEDKANEGKKEITEKTIMDNLKDVDKFALKFYQTQFTYEDFIKEKESKTNFVYYPSEDEDNSNIDEELDLGLDESDDEKLNKLDLDQAYEMYLEKRSEIMKTFEMINGDNYQL